MSGGFTPGLRHKSLKVDAQASWLASEHYSAKRAGATFDAALVAADEDGNKVIESGTFVAPVTETGKYGPYSTTATDGREAPDPNRSGYLWESINLKDGDVIEGVLLHGSVLEARVKPEVDDTIRGAVTGRITFQ